MLRQVSLGILLAFATAVGAARAEPALYVHPEDRAAGNRLPAATALARALLTERRPATVEQVRIDGAGGREVAGIVLSGVKFHRTLSAEGFLSEVASLVALSFASSAVEEVDVWARVPIRVPKGAIVTGDFAVPVSKIVFGCTVRRDDLPRLDALLHTSAVVYWEPEFAKRLAAFVDPSPSPERTGSQPRQSG